MRYAAAYLILFILLYPPCLKGGGFAFSETGGISSLLFAFYPPDHGFPLVGKLPFHHGVQRRVEGLADGAALQAQSHQVVAVDCEVAQGETGVFRLLF